MKGNDRAAGNNLLKVMEKLMEGSAEVNPILLFFVVDFITSHAVAVSEEDAIALSKEKDAMVYKNEAFKKREDERRNPDSTEQIPTS